PTRSAPRESPDGGGLEALSLLLGGKRIGELGQLTAEHAIEVVRAVLDPVVSDAALGEVVGADLLGALTTANLGLALGGDLGVLLGKVVLIRARAQHPHRPLLVLQLRLLVLHRDDDAARFVGYPHRRVGRVDRLTAGTG